MEGKPSFLAWVRFISSEWQHDGQDFDDVIAFAIRMAVWAEDGKEIYRSAKSLGRQAGCSIRTAKRRRAEAMRLGLFRETGRLDPHGKGMKVLEIAMPVDVQVSDRGVSDLAPLIGGESQAVKVTVIGSVNSGDPEESLQVSGQGVSDLAPLCLALASDPFAQVSDRGVSDLAPNIYSGLATPPNTPTTPIENTPPDIPTTYIENDVEDWDALGELDEHEDSPYFTSQRRSEPAEQPSTLSYRPSWTS